MAAERVVHEVPVFAVVAVARTPVLSPMIHIGLDPIELRPKSYSGFQARPNLLESSIDFTLLYFSMRLLISLAHLEDVKMVKRGQTGI